MSKKSEEPLHDILAFFPIGISALVQKAEQQWKGNTLVGDAEGEYIDVELSELPVGAVHTQNQTVLNRKQREDHPCYQVEVQGLSLIHIYQRTTDGLFKEFVTKIGENS